MVDAILNSKLSMAISQGININAKATVPKDLQGGRYGPYVSLLEI